MLGLDYRAVRYTWSVAFTLLLLRVIYLIRETLFIFVVALLFAYLLWPLVDFFDRRLPGKSRAPALAIVYSLLVGLLTRAIQERLGNAARELREIAANESELVLQRSAIEERA